MFLHTCTCSVCFYLGVWGTNIRTHLCPESFLNLPCMCVPARWYCWPPERTRSSNHWQTSWPRGWTARWCRWEKNRGMTCIRWWRRGSCIGRTWRTWVKLFNISASLSRWQCEYTQLWLICEVFFSTSFRQRQTRHQCPEPGRFERGTMWRSRVRCHGGKVHVSQSRWKRSNARVCWTHTPSKTKSKISDKAGPHWQQQLLSFKCVKLTFNGFVTS